MKVKGYLSRSGIYNSLKGISWQNLFRNNSIMFQVTNLIRPAQLPTTSRVCSSVSS